MTAAMIFAAGFGTRMGALTRDTPKPMLPLAGRPMVDHALNLLRDAGIAEIVANTHYLPDRITPHLMAQDVTVLHEDPILETGGGLRAALPALGAEPVITLNPDSAWKGPNPVELLCEAWRDDMQALLMLVDVDKALGTAPPGDFSLEHGRIRRKGPFRYTGLQLLRTDRLQEIPGEAFSLNAYWDLLAEDAPLHGIEYPGTWCDIGHPQGLAQAEALLAS